MAYCTVFSKKKTINVTAETIPAGYCRKISRALREFVNDPAPFHLPVNGLSVSSLAIRFCSLVHPWLNMYVHIRGVVSGPSNCLLYLHRLVDHVRSTMAKVTVTRRSRSTALFRAGNSQFPQPLPARCGTRRIRRYPAFLFGHASACPSKVPKPPGGRITV